MGEYIQERISGDLTEWHCGLAAPETAKPSQERGRRTMNRLCSHKKDIPTSTDVNALYRGEVYTPGAQGANRMLDGNLLHGLLRRRNPTRRFGRSLEQRRAWR